MGHRTAFILWFNKNSNMTNYEELMVGKIGAKPYRNNLGQL